MHSFKVIEMKIENVAGFAEVSKPQIGSSSDYANDVIIEPHRILGVIDIREVIYLPNIYYAQPVYSQYSLSVLMSSQPGMPFLVMW